MFKKALLVLVIAAAVMIPPKAVAGEKWQGTDDLVDSKMKQITGVSAREPLIDINQGNMGLFIFTAGGFSAGIVFGYQWRKIFHEKAGTKHD